MERLSGRGIKRSCNNFIDWPNGFAQIDLGEQNVVERAVILSEIDTFVVDESWLKRESADSLPREGPMGEKLELIVTDGRPGLAAALQTVYPRVAHQRCWVHKMRNILEKVRKRDSPKVKSDAQAIYQAESQPEARAAFRRFRTQWQGVYPAVVPQLEQDLPELLSFFSLPVRCGGSCGPRM